MFVSGLLRARRAATLLLATLAPVVWAVPVVALDPQLRLSQYGHRMWQEELPQTTVHDIEQTDDGYLWFGTYNGLVRFDGVRFTVFDAGSRPALPANGVLTLHRGRDGRLWIGTSAGVAVLQGDSVTSWTIRDGLPGRVVEAVAPAGGGAMWIGTRNGLARLTATGGVETFAIPGRRPPEVRALLPAADDHLWLCTEQGLLRLDTATRSVEDSFAGFTNASCRDLIRGHDGTVWVGTRAGLGELRDGRLRMRTTADGLPSNIIRALFEDRDRALWIGTQDAGLARLAGGRIDVFGARQGLSHILVRCVYEDREGSIWVGTSAGIDQLRAAKVTAYTAREGLSNNFVRTVLEDRDGTIWIGTDGGGLNRFDGEQFSHLTTADGLADSSVRGIAQTPDGVLWIGTRAGLNRLDPGGGITTFTAADGLAGNGVRVVYADPAGGVWIGTDGAGASHLAGGRFTTISSAQGLAGDDVRAIHRDRRGRLWIGTFSGLSVMVHDTITSYRHRDGLVNENVLCFHEDDRGGLWLGTEGGIGLLRNGRFSFVDTSHGLIDNNVFRMLPDAGGNIWMTSSRGLQRIALDSLYAVAEGRAGTVTAEHLDTSHGMPTDHCNGASQPAGWRGRDGRLWFPTSRGVVSVDPEHLVRNKLPPPVLIEEVAVDGTAFPPQQLTSIPAGAHNYELRYTAPSLVAPERVRFRYRLDRFDSAWTEAAGRRVAYYTKLPPGSYTFQVVACNNDGVWNETGASYSFVVQAALWQTWWARILLVAAIGLAVLLAHRLRLRALAGSHRLLEAEVARRTAELDDKNAALAEKVEQLELSERQAHEAQRRAVEANRAKSLFLSNMSHELRTPLNSIIGFAGILTQRLEGSLEPRLFHFLSNIFNSGQHLLGLINDLLDLSKVEAGRMEISLERFELGAITDSVCRLMQGVCDVRDISIEVELAPDLPALIADLVRCKQILFNLLSNAVKFSADGSKVTVRAAPVSKTESPLQRRAVRIDVIDRGIGIAAEHQSLIFEEFRQVEADSDRRFQGTGLGLSLVKQLLELQGGTITLSSEPGRGSTFSAYLPLQVEARLAVEAEPPALDNHLLQLRPPTAGLAGPEILVVEDDPAAFHQLAASLENDGFRVLSARTGEEALKLLAERLPTLVTLDLVLPGLDGWEVLRQIKSGERTRQVPVVILTRRENRELCLALGADDFFLKPVERELFLRRVHELVSPPPSRDAAKILVVDDDPTVHELLREHLEPAGLQMLAATGGREGLHLARREHPDLVVLDLVMPDLSGFEVARQLRADADTSRIPIIVLTARDPNGSERARLADAISALITKGPEGTVQLMETIRNLVGR